MPLGSSDRLRIADESLQLSYESRLCPLRCAPAVTISPNPVQLPDEQSPGGMEPAGTFETPHQASDTDLLVFADSAGQPGAAFDRRRWTAGAGAPTTASMKAAGPNAAGVRTLQEESPGNGQPHP